MGGEKGLPQAFLDAMEHEMQSWRSELTRQSDDRIAELLVQRREDASRAIRKRAAEAEKDFERCVTQRHRKMRALEAAYQKKLSAIRLDRLQSLLRERLEAFRNSAQYASFLKNLFLQCGIEGFRGKGTLEAAPLEAELFRRSGTLTESAVTLVEKDPGRWGGFILKGEGGSLFDCTLQTRWEQYRKRLESQTAGREQL